MAFVSWEGAGPDAFGTDAMAAASLAKRWAGALDHSGRHATRLWTLGVTRRRVLPRGQHSGRQGWLTSA